MVEPLNDAELAMLVEKLRTLYAGHTAEQIPNTLAMAEVESIYSLKISSNRLEKLTEELSKSSKALENLTKFLIALTVLLLIITYVELPADFPLWLKAMTLLILFVITLGTFILKKNK